MDNQHKNQKAANAAQDILTDTLFAAPEHISDVKQVLEISKDFAQPLRQEQVQALIYLNHLGSNSLLHGDKNPYEDICKQITGDYKVATAPSGYYLDMVDELVPKPPKPIVVANNGRVIESKRR